MRGCLSLFFGALGLLIVGLFAIGVINRVGSMPEDKILRKAITKSIEAIKDKPLSDSLTIDMVRLSAFQWDTLYVFRGYNSEKFISQAIGVSWTNGSPDDWWDENPDNLLIFINKRKVASYIWYQGVARENKPAPDFIHFQMHINNGELFTPATAKFIICKEKLAPHFIQLFIARGKEPIYRPGFDRQNFNYFE
jgi:hypothetical protein